MSVCDFKGPTTINHQQIMRAPKVNDPYNALMYVRGSATYFHDSCHKTTTLTKENDASPLR